MNGKLVKNVDRPSETCLFLFHETGKFIDQYIKLYVRIFNVRSHVEPRVQMINEKIYDLHRNSL